MYMETLTDKFRQVADEYARQVAALLGYKEWSWIGVDDTTGDGTRNVLEVGDWLYLSLSDLQVIIDRLDEWVRRYGSREAVAQEIEDWQEWWLGDKHDGDAATTEAVLSLWESRRERYLRTYPRINLEHWLMGCPRDRKPESPHDRLRRLKVTREMLSELVQQYRPQRSLWNIIDNLTTDIKAAQAEADRLDAETLEQMRQSPAYKDFEQAVSEAVEN